MGLWVRLIVIAAAAAAVVWGGLTALDSSRADFMAGQVEHLRRDAETVAALLTNAVVPNDRAGAVGTAARSFDAENARLLVERTASSANRLLLFDATGRLVAASALREDDPWLVTPLSPLQQAYRDFARWLRPNTTFATDGAGVPLLAHFPEVNEALGGASAVRVEMRPDGRRALIAVIPVRWEQTPIGALVMASMSAEADRPDKSGLQRVGLALGVGALVFGMSAVLLLLPLRRSLADLGMAIERVLRREPGAVVSQSGPGGVLAPVSAPAARLALMLQTRTEEAELYAREVAHELKNPLTSLRSAVETAAMITDPAQHKRLMEVIVQDVARLDRLISAVTDLSQVDAEMASMPVERIDLAAMLAAIVEIENAASQANWAPQFVLLHGGGPFVVQGADTRLAQVFRNLMSNARSFSPPGSRIRLTLTRQGDSITITCDDDGPGIPSGREETIFQRFYSDRPDSDPFAGHSGLGLSLCRQIVQAHRGTIWAENRLDPFGHGIGARFSIMLPAA